MLRTSLLSLVVIGLCAATVAAQTSYPMVMSLKPVAVQVGTTAECEVSSRYSMLGAFQVFVSGTGVTAEIIPPVMPELKPGEKPKDVTKLKLKITAAADALPGVREFRLGTPNGASTLGQVVIVRDPVVAEQAENNTRDKAQPVTFPATLCGTIEKAEDFDFYKFTVAAGDKLTFHVRAQRLEDKIHDLQTHVDPILFLRDASGGVVAMSDNAFFADPFLAHTFAQAGDYFLEIRDVRFQGNVEWVYAIEVNGRPFPTQAFPMAVAAGQEGLVDLVGPFVPAGAKATVPPQSGANGFRWLPLSLNEQVLNPVPVYVSGQPIVVEPPSENNTPATAVEVTAPVVISGRIEQPADLDVYAFTAKKGDKLSFQVMGRRFQSQLDSYLRILNEKEQVLREDDDGRFGKLLHADTWLEGWEVPADGKYFVEIRDVHLRGGDGFGYLLELTPTVPTFELIVDTDKTNLTPGTHGVLFVRANRKHGFKGDVQLHVDGLPAGVTATCGRALSTKYPDGAIVLSALPEATLAAAPVRIWGTAELPPAAEGAAPQMLTVEATPYQETYNPGGGRVHFSSETHVVNVGQPSDLRKVEISETDIRLKPGESRKILVKIERNTDVKANVTLDLTYNHLEQIYASSLPDGVTIDGGQSKTLLSGGASEGFITIKADKTAAPVEKQLACVMAHFSINFVMKATYTSPPLFITVEPGEPAK